MPMQWRLMAKLPASPGDHAISVLQKFRKFGARLECRGDYLCMFVPGNDRPVWIRDQLRALDPAAQWEYCHNPEIEPSAKEAFAARLAP